MFKEKTHAITVMYFDVFEEDLFTSVWTASKGKPLLVRFALMGMVDKLQKRDGEIVKNSIFQLELKYKHLLGTLYAQLTYLS
jgi:ABC-type ATPase with predicted acetyltransferase domain